MYPPLSLTILLIAVRSALAQGPPAVCTTRIQPLDTRTGLSPCEVANVVQARNSLPITPPLDPGFFHYPSPSLDVYPTASSITCTTIFYNLLCACAACQHAPDGTPIEWPTLQQWMVKCPELGFPPDDLNLATTEPTIPRWASTAPPNGVFNLTFLVSVANPPETHSVVGATATAVDSIPPSEAVSSSPQSASASTSGPPIGAIVGGVVGGVFILLLIGGLVFFLRRRKANNTRQAPSAEFMNSAHRHVPLPQSDMDEESGVAPPAFTPGVFKDPIFEKGVARASLATTSTSIPYTPTHSSPITMSDHASAAGGDHDLVPGPSSAEMREVDPPYRD